MMVQSADAAGLSLQSSDRETVRYVWQSSFRGTQPVCTGGAAE
jgi:hypothetical protein